MDADGFDHPDPLAADERIPAPWEMAATAGTDPPPTIEEHGMKSDSVKLYASTLTAVVMAIGGCLLLVFVAMQPGIDGKDGLMALLGGFIGFAIQFLFGQETATRSVRSYERGLNTTVVEPPA